MSKHAERPREPTDCPTGRGSPFACACTPSPGSPFPRPQVCLPHRAPSVPHTLRVYGGASAHLPCICGHKVPPACHALLFSCSCRRFYTTALSYRYHPAMKDVAVVRRLWKGPGTATSMRGLRGVLRRMLQPPSAERVMHNPTMGLWGYECEPNSPPNGHFMKGSALGWGGRSLPQTHRCAAVDRQNP